MGYPKSSESYGIPGYWNKPWIHGAIWGLPWILHDVHISTVAVLAVEVEQWDYDLREKHREELELLMDFLNGGPKEVATEDPWWKTGWFPMMGHGITQQVSNGLPYGHILNPLFFFPIRSPREFYGKSKSTMKCPVVLGGIFSVWGNGLIGLFAMKYTHLGLSESIRPIKSKQFQEPSTSRTSRSRLNRLGTLS